MVILRIIGAAILTLLIAVGNGAFASDKAGGAVAPVVKYRVEQLAATDVRVGVARAGAATEPVWRAAWPVAGSALERRAPDDGLIIATGLVPPTMPLPLPLYAAIPRTVLERRAPDDGLIIATGLVPPTIPLPLPLTY